VTGQSLRSVFSLFNKFRELRGGKMNIREAKIVPDTRIYPLRNVSKEAGRKVMERLRARGVIDPMITGTHRRLLSFAEAEILANAL